MQRLRNHLIGVDQGSKVLFSDFDTGGEMWTGTGSRTRHIPVKFNEKFKTQPSVMVSLDMWDIDQKSNQRADVGTTSISADGFEIIFRTWGDTKVARVRASWMAIGEVKSEDEWEI